MVYTQGNVFLGLLLTTWSKVTMFNFLQTPKEIKPHTDWMKILAQMTAELCLIIILNVAAF